MKNLRPRPWWPFRERWWPPLAAALSIAYALAVLMSGCASAPPADPRPMRVSLLPVQVDVDKLLPVDEAPLSLPNGPRHKVPVDEGTLACDEARKSCQPLPPGILLDEGTYASLLADKSAARRLRTELSVVRDLRVKEHVAVREAERLYQQGLVDLDKENARLREPTAWGSLKFYVGFVLGAALTGMAAYGAAQAVR